SHITGIPPRWWRTAAGTDNTVEADGMQSQEHGRRQVAVVYRSLPQYRRQFYELVREGLGARGVEFKLIYGDTDAADDAKQDRIELPWATRIPNRIVRLGSRFIYWQPCLRELKRADLVIVEQASKLLLNYVLLVQQFLGVRRLAFWGHGRNFQRHTASALGEAVKRLMSRRVWWWFAYNDASSAVVRELGFPAERITSVQNSIDTRALVEARSRLAPADLERVRAELGIVGEHVCVFAGSIYSEKRIDFLLAACERVRERVPGFELIVIGAGPDARKVSEAARRHPWIHYVGPRFDDEKVPYFAISKLLLLPGLVGLAVLDAFALETPLVTTDVDFHSPEIDYLDNGVNGVVVSPSDDPAAYAVAVAELLEDEPRRARLVQGCRESRAHYSVEEMAARFTEGVLGALEKAGAA
ncbi:MAG TPA: glycosyltransferase family 4 protein, partial [Longimicrobium sp.]|nr:glycosyltransferase family 4 protein [Longimicrobium sp.]